MLPVPIDYRWSCVGGIFAALSLRREDVAPLIVEGLKRLRFRGNDCAGIAVVGDDGLRILKERGDVEDVDRSLGLSKLRGWVALGHTRFSTHGRPYRDNAHPHIDCRGEVAVVGDGAIANYEELRDELAMEGHRIVSRSDFEVVAHLIEDGLAKGETFLKAFAAAVERLRGFYVVAALHRSGTIAVYTSKLPVYLGIGDGLYTVASTHTALYGAAREYVEVLGGEIAVVSSSGIAILRPPNLLRVERGARRLELDLRLVDKGGYPHHMLREIYEVPYALLRTIATVQVRFLEFAARLLNGARNIFIVADGTSLHAGFVASYYFTELAGVNPIVVSAAEFPLYYIEGVGPGTVVVAISQSGETGDVISSVYEAKLRGATILGITNYVGSKLAMFSNLYLPIGAGPELAVPATKTFTSTLALLYLLALNAGRLAGKLTPDEVRELTRRIERLSDELIRELPRIDRGAREAARLLAECRSGYVISRGINYPIALEGALKLKEASYMHAEGMEAGEFRHGPVVLVEKGFFTVFILPVERRAAEATYPLIRDAHSKGATVVVVGPSEELAAHDLPGHKIGVPPADRHLAPIASSVPLQLLAYHLGVLRGLPIDGPRYLTKAVRR